MPAIPSFGVNLADDTNATARVSDLAIAYRDDHPDLAERSRTQQMSVTQGEDAVETHSRGSQRLLVPVQETRSSLAEIKRRGADAEVIDRAQRAYDEAVATKAQHDAKGRVLLSGLGGDRNVLAAMNRVIDQLARSEAEPELLPDIALPDGNPLDILKAALSTRALLQADSKVRNEAPEPEAVVLERLLKELPEDDGFGLPKVSFRKGRERLDFGVAAVSAAPGDNDGGAIPHVVDLQPFVMRLGRDLLREHIQKIVREHYASLTGVTPLSDADRAAKLADIAAKLAEVERIEVEATWAARASGHYVPFRADVNVRTVLGIK